MCLIERLNLLPGRERFYVTDYFGALSGIVRIWSGRPWIGLGFVCPAFANLQ
jgi:hypothetical protein